MGPLYKDLEVCFLDGLSMWAGTFATGPLMRSNAVFACHGLTACEAELDASSLEHS